MISKTYKAMSTFLSLEASSGIILFIMAIFALLMANSPFSHAYESWKISSFYLPFKIFHIKESVLFWVNDGLMALFFLVVGLEIKGEILEGQLHSLKKSALPLLAAFGGIIIPGLIFILVNLAHPENWSGFAIPMATDIAFSLGVLVLLGPRIPVSLKVFLTALAIIDDLGAILLIAFFYTHSLQVIYFLYVSICLLCLFLLNFFTVTHFAPYAFLGAILWFLILKLGVHPTLAGVLLALFIPLKTHLKIKPLKLWIKALHPWVAFFILPVFAFLNAGTSLHQLTFSQLFQPLTLGILIALILGKPLGVYGFSWLSVKLDWTHFPHQMTSKSLKGISVLCGIGFTMSLFIGTLAFGDAGETTMNSVKLGVLAGSFFSGIVGYILLRKTVFQ